MTIGLILKRIRREWRALGILLLAVCLLTGFFALGPFYIRAVTEVGLRYELDNAAPRDLQVQLIARDTPLTAEEFDIVREELGDLGVDFEYYIRASYNPPTSSTDFTGLATTGYTYRFGVPVTFLPRTARAYQPFAFDNMEEKLTLVEGRWPRRLPTPDQVSPDGLSDAEQQARKVGIYSRGQVEVVVTRTVADEAELELGERLVLAAPTLNGFASASVVIVGIVEPKNTGDLFWEGNRNFLFGSNVENQLGVVRFDFGMATLTPAYTDWLTEVTPGNEFVYVIDTDTSVITADNIRDINERVNSLQRRIDQYHPGFYMLTKLTNILERYSKAVDNTEGPIVLLSGAILVMMLYHLINTVALVLEQQGTEWSAIVSRGGSVPQLIFMQVVTVGILGIIGMLAGPLLSVIFMQLMERFGPLATALGGHSVNTSDIPALSQYLSVGAAVATVVVLTIPAFPAARKSLLRLKQLISRPPTQPAWARYSLDVILLIIGIAFMLRLYYMEGGDFGDLLNNLIAAPREVINLIADNQGDSGGLNDPFNLLAPALILTGAALVWLRFFPWLMERIARLFRRSRHLTSPLAIWNVARDPGHYAQLVLLLIGTLALGTASLALIETRDKGAWETARDETGGSGRVELDATSDQEADKIAWDQMPGVSDAVVFMHAAGDPGSMAPRDVHIIGLDPENIPAAFSELADVADWLREVEVPAPPGIELPDTARQLEVQVYSLPTEKEEDPTNPNIAVGMIAYLQDALGVPYSVPLYPPDTVVIADVQSGEMISVGVIETPTDQWLTFEGEMPEGGRTPYRLLRIGMDSRQLILVGNAPRATESGAFDHTIYLDQLATRDAFGKAEVVDGFETPANNWVQATVADVYASPWVAWRTNVEDVQGMTLQRVETAVEGIAAIEGTTALRLDYGVNSRRTEPSIAVNEPDLNLPPDVDLSAGPGVALPHMDRIPVVISREFAEQFAGTSAQDEPLTVGDQKRLSELNMGSGSIAIDYEVIGVIDKLPSFDAKDTVLITHIDLIRPLINHQASASNVFFDENETWLQLPNRKPGQALKDEIAGIESVQNVVWAWTRYGEIQREPLPSAVAGMLFAGFWISLLLSLLDFAFYLVVTARQRLFTFAVLRSLGWNASHIWRLLFIEQVALIAPALIIGSLIGTGLAYLLLPFLALVGGETLQLPWLNMVGLLMTLVISFTGLMGVAAVFLRRMSMNQALRLGEE